MVLFTKKQTKTIEELAVNAVVIKVSFVNGWISFCYPKEYTIDYKKMKIAMKCGYVGISNGYFGLKLVLSIDDEFLMFNSKFDNSLRSSFLSKIKSSCCIEIDE